MKLIIFSLIFSFSLFAKLSACPKIKYDKSNLEQTYIAEKICKVMLQIYPELLKTRIKVKAIEDSFFPNLFSKGQFAFLSFYNLGHLIPGPWGYYIAYSRDLYFPYGFKPLSEWEELRIERTIAHELAHTYTWRRWQSLSSLFLATYVIAFTNRGEFERKNDILAIKKSIAAGVRYTPEHVYMRENLRRSKLVYYSQYTIHEIEEMALSLEKKMRKKFFRKLYRKAPYSLSAIKKIYEKIKDK